MKTKLFFITVFLFWGITMQAQMTNNAIWTEYNINIQNNTITSKWQYWTTNDTVFDGKTYKKVVDKNGYLGAIREENGKIYARYSYYEYGGHIDEFLLYDFTLQVGETIKSTAIEGALSYPDGLTVEKIEEITLENGEVRKKFIFYLTEPWIEGIGSIGGLFYDVEGHATNYIVSHLVCFQNNNTSVFIDDIHCLDGKCCEILSGEEVDIVQIPTHKEIVIYPNPTYGTSFLSLPFLDSKYIEIRILDKVGREIHKQFYATSESIEVNLSNYPSDLYYVIAQGNESSLFFCKVIKK